MNAALVAVDGCEVAALVTLGVFLGERAHAPHPVRARPFNLDNVSAHVAQNHGAVRTGNRLGQIDYPHIGQRPSAPAGHWRCPLMSVEVSSTFIKDCHC